MKKVIATVPTRVDLAGGTLDIQPMFRLIEDPVTINLGVGVFTTVTITVRDDRIYEIHSLDQNASLRGDYSKITRSPDLPLMGLVLKNFWEQDFPGLTIEVHAQSPKGAGLGGSSALALGMIAALDHSAINPRDSVLTTDEILVNHVQALETKLIRVPTGCQDYWGALRGGLNTIKFPLGGAHCATEFSDMFRHFEDRVILVFTGQSRDSGINNWEIFQNAFNGHQQTISSLDRIARSARDMALALEGGHFERAIEHSRAEWQYRRDLWPNIETEVTKHLANIGHQSGALLARVCGAGGGGVMMFLVDHERRGSVHNAITAELRKIPEARILDGSPTNKGLTIQVF